MRVSRLCRLCSISAFYSIKSNSPIQEKQRMTTRKRELAVRYSSTCQAARRREA